jgi:F-type H+-transporting ATPase subunit b
LEAADRSKRELELAEHKAIAIIREAKTEASQIVDNAHKRSIQIIDEAKENARTESKRILDNAGEEMLREVSKTKEGLRKQLAGLAVAGAGKIIKRNLDESAQR